MEFILLLHTLYDLRLIAYSSEVGVVHILVYRKNMLGCQGNPSRQARWSKVRTHPACASIPNPFRLVCYTLFNPLFGQEKLLFSS